MACVAGGIDAVIINGSHPIKLVTAAPQKKYSFLSRSILLFFFLPKLYFKVEASTEHKTTYRLLAITKTTTNNEIHTLASTV